MIINKERILNKFLQYIKIDSESLNEKNFSDILNKELKTLGGKVDYDEANKILGGEIGNLFCQIKGNENYEPIILCAHLDTVKPGKNINPIIDKGIIKSDGKTILGADDKAGVVCIMEAVRYILENNIEHPPIEIVFTISEELRLEGSKNLDFTKLSGKKGIVVDSSGKPGNMVISAPAKITLNGKFIGKKAHAGMRPEMGISAIQMAAYAVNKMNLLRIDEETTSNIGTFKAEFANNIVPDSVFISGEIRSRNNEKLKKESEYMMSCIEEACKKFNGNFEGGIDVTYLSYTHKEDDFFILKIKEACKNIGLIPNFINSGGGSDANNFMTKGIKMVDISCGMNNSHSLDEYISIDDLVTTTKLIIEIIKINLIK